MSSRTRKQPARYATLEQWRKAHRFTLEQAAEYLGEPLTTYYNWERGSRRPKPEALKRVMARTGVAVEFLAGVA